MMIPRSSWVLLLPLLLAACPGDRAVDRCTEPVQTGMLPDEIAESSGVLVSRRHPGTLWTHNDASHTADLFAIDSAGTLLGRTRVTDAENLDWEDIAYGPCIDGSGQDECLYIGDIGDNLELRREIIVYVVTEPAPGDAATEPALRLRMRYPDEPRDAEALAVVGDGRLLVITKGRNHPPAIFQWPGRLPRQPPADAITLEHVQELAEGEVWIPDQITGASTTPDGGRLAVRSYTWLQFFRPLPDGRFEPLSPRIDLTPAAEPQGEGVDIRGDGTVFLTSEAGPLDRNPTVSMMRCRLAD